jgi:hypothetical protein
LSLDAELLLSAVFCIFGTQYYNLHMRLIILALAMMSLPSFSGGPQITVTDGQVKQSAEGFRVESNSSRFEIVGSDGESLALQVRYDGATGSTSTLASGASVSQVALKLRSLNQCNLVYVARRFSPKSEIVIMIKENPGKSTHQECGDGGYKRIGSVALPSVQTGQTFSIGGSFQNNKLSVSYEGKEVWTGEVAFDRKGDSGVRTDNSKVSIKVK